MKDISVVYIDDEDSLCDIFKRIFHRNGVSVRIFSDYKIALEEISISRPDLLFIDYRLNGINGDQVAQKMDHSIPKILITGELDVDSIYPFINILSKPAPPHIVQTIIDSFRN